MEAESLSSRSPAERLRSRSLATSLPYLWMREWGFVPTYDDPHRAANFGLTEMVTGGLVENALGSLGMGIVVVRLWLLVGAIAGAQPRILSPNRVDASGRQVGMLAGVRADGDHRTTFHFPARSRILQALVPGFDAVRVPVRMLLVTHLGLALLVAIGLQRVMVWPASVGLAWAIGARDVGSDPDELWLSSPRSLFRRGRWGTTGPAGVSVARPEHGEGRPLLELPRGSAPTRARRMALSAAPLASHHRGVQRLSVQLRRSRPSACPSAARTETLSAN